VQTAGQKRLIPATALGFSLGMRCLLVIDSKQWNQVGAAGEVKEVAAAIVVLHEAPKSVGLGAGVLL